MDVAGYAYIGLSEGLHLLINNEQHQDNELLRNGLLLVVQEGIETAKTIEEVEALKIRKLIVQLKRAET